MQKNNTKSDGISIRRTISDEMRLSIINHADQYRTIKWIAEAFNLPRITVSTIVSAYFKDGVTTSKRRGGDHSAKLTYIIKQCILDLVDENTSITLKELSNKDFELHYC